MQAIKEAISLKAKEEITGSKESVPVKTKIGIKTNDNETDKSNKVMLTEITPKGHKSTKYRILV